VSRKKKDRLRRTSTNSATLASVALTIFIVGLAAGHAFAVTVPADVKQVVTFILLPGPKGELKPNGTAFFVGIKDEQITNRTHVYLVTARHVIQDGAKNFYPVIFVRLNKRGGGTDVVPIQLAGHAALPVYVNKTDPDVDIAVLPFLPSQQIYDFKWIPEDMLTTRESFKLANIREGDEVFFTGLFGHFIGAQRNYPIVRFGRVALVTDEKIPWREAPNRPAQMLDLYLIEAQSFGGNSGSPVFFYLGGEREPLSLMGRQLLLAGVIKGSFDEGRPIQDVENTPIPFASTNVGIAAVVPAFRLREILFSPELQSVRRASR
jgi:hypothetical protein